MARACLLFDPVQANDSPQVKSLPTIVPAAIPKIRGNELTLQPDRGNPDQYLFRLEQVSEDAGRTWTEKLFMMQPTRVTTLDGAEVRDNEIALERRNP